MWNNMIVDVPQFYKSQTILMLFDNNNKNNREVYEFTSS